MTFTCKSVAPFEGEEIVSLADAKAACRVLHADEDEFIGSMRDAAVGAVETLAKVALSRRAFRWTGSGFPDCLPVEPVHEVTGMSYLDGSGASVALSSTAWRLAAPALSPAAGGAWPSGVLSGAGVVTVLFEAGYEDAAAEAPALIAAVKLMTAHLYRNREAVITGTIATEAPLGVMVLIGLDRTPTIG